MELLDILDEDGNIIGTEERKIIHEKGLWHIHVGAWLMNEEGKLLYQKRAETKKRNPNKWGRTGGHLDSGEIPIIGVQREIQEELGVKIPENKLELINIDKTEADEFNHYFTYNYFVYVDYKIQDYTIQKEELSELKYISIEEMEELKKQNDENYTFTKWDKFDEIILMLKQKREELKSVLQNNIECR